MSTRAWVSKLLLAVLLVLLARGNALCASEVLDVTVTSPWLALLTGFIGGANVKVSAVHEWNERGDLVRRVGARSLASLPVDAMVMAFDVKDAKTAGLPAGKYASYRSLYEHMPLGEKHIDTFLSDPSVAIFIAQRVLTVLADWNPSNYPYYQRRLAEFQARLYSTTLAGRQVLKDQPVYDLSGHSTALLQAAGCKIEKPASHDLALWTSSKSLDLLRETVDKKIADKVPVVIDYSTPRAIRGALAAQTAVFLFKRPSMEQDYPSFIHDQYLSLWAKVTSQPLPKPQPKKAPARTRRR